MILIFSTRTQSLKNSWRFGLKSAAWGNPDSLKDSDILRYQWPAIGKGWERGLLKFASAQRRQDDVGLLHRVIRLPNTTVAVIVGSKDRVIPPKLTRQFLANFPSDEVDLIEIKGLGHNAFEEDVDAFMEAVEAIVKSSGGTLP
jgi:pimeloyl-ACP methyl ester carboxylesterase